MSDQTIELSIVECPKCHKVLPYPEFAPRIIDHDCRSDLNLIQQAAILKDGVVWTLPRPARHHHIIAAMNDVLGAKGVFLTAKGVQGFIDGVGTFWTREQAANIAQANGQLTKPLLSPPKLYSEDLW